MKRFYSLLIFAFLLQPLLFSQTGTIKIAKPTPPPQQTPPPQSAQRKRHFGIQPYAGGNYTFKNNHKIGYQAGIALMFPIFHNNRFGLSFGPEYCFERKYVELSDHSAQPPYITPFTKSQSRSIYLKIPVKMLCNIYVGPRMILVPCIGLKPEYLLTTTDEQRRLGPAAYSRYNLAWAAGLGFMIKTHFTLSAEYSNDLFENLKDRNIYDSSGAVIGKQKSKTKLLSLLLYYNF